MVVTTGTGVIAVLSGAMINCALVKGGLSIPLTRPITEMDPCDCGAARFIFNEGGLGVLGGPARVLTLRTGDVVPCEVPDKATHVIL